MRLTDTARRILLDALQARIASVGSADGELDCVWAGHSEHARRPALEALVARGLLDARQEMGLRVYSITDAGLAALGPQATAARLRDALSAIDEPGAGRLQAWLLSVAPALPGDSYAGQGWGAQP